MLEPVCANPACLTLVQEFWRYSYPLHKDSVPSWSVPVISLCGPAAVLIAYFHIADTPRLEVHNAVLNGLMCVITTAFITNLVKLGVRLVPWLRRNDHFRCLPFLSTICHYS